MNRVSFLTKAIDGIEAILRGVLTGIIISLGVFLVVFVYRLAEALT